jgi:hypothetical protein
MTRYVWASGLRSFQAFSERHGITFLQTLFLRKNKCYETEINKSCSNEERKLVIVVCFPGVTTH